MTGEHRRAPTLPSSLILNQAERDEIARHIAELKTLSGPTPIDDNAAEKAMFVVVTKMMLAYPTRKENDVAAESRGEAFLAAVEDLPVWAVAAAARRWYRDDGGVNGRGEPFDYHWCPAPAELRRIAARELARIKARAQALKRLFDAEPLIEFTDEHCAAMRAKLADLFRNLGTSPVGSDGSGGAVNVG